MILERLRRHVAGVEGEQKPAHPGLFRLHVLERLEQQDRIGVGLCHGIPENQDGHAVDRFQPGGQGVVIGQGVGIKPRGRHVGAGRVELEIDAHLLRKARQQGDAALADHLAVLQEFNAHVTPLIRVMADVGKGPHGMPRKRALGGKGQPGDGGVGVRRQGGVKPVGFPRRIREAGLVQVVPGQPLVVAQEDQLHVAQRKAAADFLERLAERGRPFARPEPRHRRPGLLVLPHDGVFHLPARRVIHAVQGPAFAPPPMGPQQLQGFLRGVPAGVAGVAGQHAVGGVEDHHAVHAGMAQPVVRAPLQGGAGKRQDQEQRQQHAQRQEKHVLVDEPALEFPQRPVEHVLGAPRLGDGMPAHPVIDCHRQQGQRQPPEQLGGVPNHLDWPVTRLRYWTYFRMTASGASSDRDTTRWMS